MASKADDTPKQSRWDGGAEKNRKLIGGTVVKAEPHILPKVPLVLNA